MTGIIYRKSKFLM